MTEILRDSHGKLIGRIDTNGNEQKLFDEHGAYLGRYDGRCTYDSSGRLKGYGNLLTSLL